MTDGSETSNAKARLTSKEKGKGKRKRPAPISQAADGGGVNDDSGEDVVDTTKRQFTRSTRSKRGDGNQTIEVSQSRVHTPSADDFTQTSTQGLPSGLAILPLPPALLDYQDLVPEGILQALDAFVPPPIASRTRTRTRKQDAPKVDAANGLSELLRLQKELTIAQTMIIERDTDLDQMRTAIQMLSEEIKLWVTRCRQLVGVMQVVEMERDNFKAGEGHAKELGTGFKVKLEQGDSESGLLELSEITAELADTKAQLAIARMQAEAYKVRFDIANSLFDEDDMEIIGAARSLESNSSMSKFFPDIFHQ